MTGKTKAVCACCDDETLYDPSKGHLPPGWVFRKVGGTVYTFCDDHGAELLPGVDYPIDHEKVPPELRERIKKGSV